MYLKTIAALLLLIGPSCSGGQSSASEPATLPVSAISTNTITTIQEIPLPEGYKRIIHPGYSFAGWLRNLPLKEDKTVYLYNGQMKRNQSAQFAVLDVSVGDRDLQQCADAVMRLRAEYLFERKQYSSLLFIDNEGGEYRLEKPFTRVRFDAYLQRVFGMCGTASLTRQLQSQPILEMQPGDVLIKGGFPGHAVIVIDMAENAAGEKIYLLAQSYMPAQDIHILNNPNSETMSPWYVLNNQDDIQTPEYFFTKEQLKTW